jgi:hypothetical protein
MTKIQELKDLLAPVSEGYTVDNLPTRGELLAIAKKVHMSGTPKTEIIQAGKIAASKGWSTVAYVKLDADGKETGRGVGSKKAYEQAMKDGKGDTIKGIAFVDPDGTVTFIE